MGIGQNFGEYYLPTRTGKTFLRFIVRMFPTSTLVLGRVEVFCMKKRNKKCEPGDLVQHSIIS